MECKFEMRRESEMSFFEELLLPYLLALLHSFDIDVKDDERIVEHELQIPSHHLPPHPLYVEMTMEGGRLLM